jgi:itaconate CoA-transferase
MLGLQNEREWQGFCAKVLRQPELAGDERFNANAKRVAAKPALQKIITDTFASLTIDDVVARLEDAQIANARVNTMRDVWAHPQLKARERWVSVATPNGDMPALLPPGMPESFDARMDPVPGLGEHTDALLAELGFAASEIEKMHAEAAI